MVIMIQLIAGRDVLDADRITVVANVSVVEISIHLLTAAADFIPGNSLHCHIGLFQDIVGTILHSHMHV